MRPMQLQLEAFGAYVQKLTLDFERELDGNNFFLIHGVTGSGKTTLLDAICFALYGSSSGGGRDGTMMRSEHATPNQPTYVEFKFSLHDKIYRVRRTPKYDKPKTRGEGTTTIQSTAELYRLDGALEILLESGASKVTDAIVSMIGFKSDQFRQVIVLPQGDFRRFLLASSKERETILTILFKTDLYRRAEDELKARALDLKRTYEAKLRQQENYLSEVGAKSAAELSQLISSIDEELRRADDEVKRLKSARDDAQRKYSDARTLSTQFHDLDRKTVECKSAASSLERIRQEQSKAREEFERRRAEEPERRRLDQRIVDLSAALTKLNELRAAMERARADEAAVKQSELDQTNLKRRLSAYERKVQELMDEEKIHGAGAEKYSAAKLRLEQCRARDQLLSTVERLSKALKLSATDVQRLDGRRTEQHRTLTRLKELSRLGRAAILAKTLLEGEPCPVCGSTHHPRLAIGGDDIPSDAELESAENLLRSIEDQKSTADRKHSALAAELDSKREELSKYAELISTAQAKSELAAATVSKDARDKCHERIREGTRYVERAKSEYEAAQRLTVDSAARASASARSVEEKTRALPEGCKVGDESRVADEIRLLRTSLDALTRAWQTADENFRRCERELAAETSRLQSLENLRAELLESLKDRARPDLNLIEDAFKVAEARYVDETKKTVRLSERIKMLSERAERLKTLALELDEIESRYRVWSRLSSVANGNVSFSRYVLHALFEDIIVEANHRLSVMSERRYLFVDRRVSTDSRKLSGLDLDVYDEYSESRRDVRTLSGGESFLASLALALGLADVVQNYSGGVKLDTIFIDEGFGTLDSETLDMAIRALMDLQSGGRLVGIISHVEELKRRIPLRLEVKKNRRGSDAHFTRR